MPDTSSPTVRHNDSYIKTITVAVPAGTAWQPQHVQQFMQSLFAVPVAMALRIILTHTSIVWSMEIARDYADAVTKALYSFYPAAEATVEAKQKADMDYIRYPFQGAAPFIAPIRHADDLSTVDPLSGILSSLNDVAPEEQVIYELVLNPATEEHYRLGEELATTPLVRWWHFLTPRSAVSAALTKVLGWDRAERFIPTVQRRVDAKLDAPLKQVNLTLKIRVERRGRANYLASLAEPAFAIFERDGFNFLVPAQPGAYPLVLAPAEVAALWHPPTEECKIPGIRWVAGAASPPPTPLIEQTTGVLLGFNRYQGRERGVRLSYADRVTHVNLIGRTRVGKSTLLHHMAYQDIVAGKGVAIVDHHGDLGDNVAEGVPQRREQDVVFIDLADTKHFIGLNPLTTPPGVSPAVAAGHTLAIIRKRFADQWSSTRMEDVLYAALTALAYVDGATLLDIPRLFSDPIFRGQVVAKISDPVIQDFWRNEFEPLSERHKREIARPVNNRVRKFFRNRTVRRMVCQRDSLDFRAILDEGKILLVNLRGIDTLEGEVLGALIISKIQMAAMSRATSAAGTRRPYYLYIDEAQNFVTTSLAKMLSEAGKYGLSLTLANQYLKQLRGETLEAVMGNVGTTIIFRIGMPDDQTLARFTRPHFSGGDLLNLPRFKAVVKMQQDGQTLPAFSMHTRPPLQAPPGALDRIDRMKAHSRKKYTRRAKAVDAEIEERFKQQTNDADHGGVSLEEVDFFG